MACARVMRVRIVQTGGGSPRIYAAEGAVGAPAFMRGKERSSALRKSLDADHALNPDFLCSLVAPARFLRLSLTKAAYAVASSASYRKSGFSAGNAQLSPTSPV